MKNNFSQYRIVENRKKILLVPLVIALITIICLVVYSFAFNETVVVGTDFTGGYQMRVKIGEKLTDDNYGAYSEQIIGIAENLQDANGKTYGIKVTDCEKYGSGSDSSIAISYQKVGSDDFMKEEVDPALKEALIDAILTSVPQVTFSNENKTVSAKYDYIVNGNIGDIKAGSLRKLGLTVVDYQQNDATSTIVFNLNDPADVSMTEQIVSALSISDEYSGYVNSSGFVSSTVSSELLQRAILAVVVAIVCMLIYIWIRFELLSGLASIIALFHDLIIMMCGMLIFRIEINQTIIAAIITILGYSINNTIIIFDRIRENVKMMPVASNAEIVNTSVKSTMSRTVFTTLTTLVMILAICILGVADIRIFALPIIFGLVAGFYSANFIAPSIWAWLGSKLPTKKGGRVKKA